MSCALTYACATRISSVVYNISENLRFRQCYSIAVLGLNWN